MDFHWMLTPFPVRGEGCYCPNEIWCVHAAFLPVGAEHMIRPWQEPGEIWQSQRMYRVVSSLSLSDYPSIGNCCLVLVLSARSMLFPQCQLLVYRHTSSTHSVRRNLPTILTEALSSLYLLVEALRIRLEYLEMAPLSQICMRAGSDTSHTSNIPAAGGAEPTV